MFDKMRIHEALYHRENFKDGTFSDDDVVLLRDYYLHLLDLTTGIPSLIVISLYAASEYISLLSIVNARGLK